MKHRIKKFFASLLVEDMARQARQVMIATLIVFILMLLTIGWLWQFKIELTAPSGQTRVVVARLNIFELLLSKK